jgi:hypothetical protein
MTDKEKLDNLRLTYKLLKDKNNKVEAELITLKTKATGWFEDIAGLRNLVLLRNTQLKKVKFTAGYVDHINSKIKGDIISFLQKTQSYVEYDALTPNQIAHRAVTFMERVLASNLPPLLAISNELKTSIRKPD